MAEFTRCERKKCPCGSAVNCNWFKKQILKFCTNKCLSCKEKGFCPFGDGIIREWKETRKKDQEADIFGEWYENSYKTSPSMTDVMGNG